MRMSHKSKRRNKLDRAETFHVQLEEVIVQGLLHRHYLSLNEMICLDKRIGIHAFLCLVLIARPFLK